MQELDSAPHVTRRDLIRNTAALTVGGFVASPLTFNPLIGGEWAQAASLARDTVKVGVLLPSSTLHRSMGANFLAGMKLRLEQADHLARERPVALIVEDAGPSSGGLHTKARKLLEEDRVDVALALAANNLAAPLGELFRQHDRTLIASNVGESQPRASDYSRHIFYNTLGLARGNQSLGQWAVPELGRRAFIAASFYESGFDALYAAQLGIESAGGEVLRSHISHLPGDQRGVGPVIDAISAARPDFVFALYSGTRAVEFVRAYAASGLGGSIPLVGSPFMVDEGLLPSMGHAATGIRSVAGWSAETRNPRNESFARSYSLWARQEADPFAVLGYDAASLLVGAVDSLSVEQAPGESFRDALRAARLDSPRGALVMDAASQTVAGPLYLREVRGSLWSRAPHNSILTELPAAGQLSERYDSIRTGWLHSYLCV